MLGHFSAIPMPDSRLIYLSISLVLIISYLLSFYLNPKLWWICRIWFFTLWIALGCLHFTWSRALPDSASAELDQHPLKAKDLSGEKATHLNAVVIKHRLKPWGQTTRYMAHYYQKNSHKPTRIVLLCRDTTLIQLLGPDKTLWTNSSPKIIERNKNPGGFDQKSYYYSQGIEFAMTLSANQVYCWRLHPLSLRAKAQKINTKLAQYWRDAAISAQAQALALAIILGQTQDLTIEVKSQFASAGALHVLALSGLHVGLVVLLLQWLLRPLKALPFGIKIQAVILLVLLWSYAFICGLSPSITRAVCMFSIWQIAQIIGRPVSGSNSVLLCLILLLWWSPYWLFSVGFQLSFSAVMALTYLPSRLKKIWRPQNRIYRYFIQLSTVGAAAQIGVGPLSIYYFHQFPLMFWLSNLIVLPLMTPLLILGLSNTMGSLITDIPNIFFELWDELLHVILNTVVWIASHEHMLLKDLNLNQYTLWSYYAIALLLWRGLQHPWVPRKIVFRTFLPYLCCILLAGYISKTLWRRDPVPQLTILHRFDNTRLIVHAPEGFKELFRGKNKMNPDGSDWSRHYGVKLKAEKPLPTVMTFDGLPEIVVDSTGVYPPVNNGIVLLRANANIHFEKLVNDLTPCIVLADGSNARYVIEHWRERAHFLNQKFLDTYSSGAIETSDGQFKKYF